MREVIVVALINAGLGTLGAFTVIVLYGFIRRHYG